MYNHNTNVYYRITQSKQVTHVSQPQKYKRKRGSSELTLKQQGKDRIKIAEDK